MHLFKWAANRCSFFGFSTWWEKAGWNLGWGMRLLNYTKDYMQHYNVPTHFLRDFPQKMGVALKFCACYVCIPIIRNPLFKFCYRFISACIYQWIRSEVEVLCMSYFAIFLYSPPSLVHACACIPSNPPPVQPKVVYETLHIPHTWTVLMYSKGVWTRDSSSGKRFEYLSRTNLWTTTATIQVYVFTHTS